MEPSHSLIKLHSIMHNYNLQKYQKIKIKLCFILMSFDLIYKALLNKILMKVKILLNNKKKIFS